MKILKMVFCVSLVLIIANATANAQDNINAGNFTKQSVGTNPGMVSYTFRAAFQKDMPGTLDKIKALGVTNIEFSNLFGQSAATIRKLLDERGMVCTSFGVSYPELVDSTNKVAMNARTLGATYVRVAWVPHDSKVGFTIEDTRKTVNDFNKAGKLLKEKYGLTFCYHSHGYEFAQYEQGTFYDYIVTHTDPQYVSFELDILWAFYAGADPVALLKKYGKRYSLMHVKDLKKGIKGDFSGATAVDNDVALGTGQINIPAIIQAAKSSIRYYYIEDESNNVQQQVPISLVYLKSLLNN